MGGKSSCKKLFFLSVVMALLISLMPVAALAVTDISGHWAKEQINEWSSKELIKGYSDNTFKPDNNITRAEFFALVNKVFGYQEKAAINFSDVSASAWYYGEIAKAVAAGYVSGYPDGTMKPEAYITRQEAAAVVAAAFGLGSGESSSVSGFKDAGQIENWAKSFVAVMKDRGFINGYPDGTFGPQYKIKRAETVIILDKASGNIVNQSDTYSQDAGGNLVVNVSDVILKDMTIAGDLYLAEGIGDGEVTLDGVTVKGKTLVKGGGENSVILRNSLLGNVEVNKPRGSGQTVRIVSEGNTNVSGTVTVNSGIKLEERGVAQGATGFNNVIVSDKLPETAKVQFSGEFKEVTSNAKQGVIEILNDAKISGVSLQAAVKLVIAEGAKVTDVTVTETARGAIIEARTEVKVQVKAENVTVNNTAVAAGSTANVSSGGITTVTTPTAGGGSNTSGSGGSGDSGGGGVTGTRVTLLIPNDGVIPYHFDAIVKNSETNTPITGLVASDFSLKKGQANIPLNSEVFYEHLFQNPQDNVPGRYTIYPVDEYRPMAGEYTLTFAKSGYVTATATFEVQELVLPDPDVELTNLELSGSPANYSFASGTYAYAGVTVPNNQATIGVTPTLTGAAITVNGTAVDSGATLQVPLAAGTEKTITVNVAKAGYTTKDYIIKVTRTIPVWSDGGTTDGPITLNPTGADNITYGPANGTHTINGNLIIEGDSTGEITVRNMTVSGDLTVNTPNATVNVDASVTVSGTTNIQAVSPNTFNSAGSHIGVIEVAGAAALNLSGNASQAPVQVNTTSPVKLKGTINLVRVLSEEAVVNIESGTVNYLQVEVNNVDVNNVGGTLTNLLVKDTVAIPPVTSGTVPPVVQLISGLTNISITVGNPADNSNIIALGEGETLAVTSSAAGVAAVAVGGAGGNEVQVTPVAAGRATIDVQVRNGSGNVVRAGTFIATIVPAAPDAGQVTLVKPALNEAVGQTKINIATSLEFRITNADGSLVKQNWSPGTGANRTTQASSPLIAGDKIEVRVKAVALNPASDKYTCTVVQGHIGEASIQGARVTITAGSAVFNYEFLGANLASVTYEEALTYPYNLNLATSTVRLEIRDGETVTHATYNITLNSLNITAGSVRYTDLDAVETAFGNPDFINTWQGPPTHVVLVLKGGLGESAWELDPITIQLRQADMDAFGSIMSPPGGGGTPIGFIPGDGGSLPVFTNFSEEPGKIGGLYVDRSHRENNLFGGGDRPVVDLYFDGPASYGAASYTLQYSGDNGATWQNYQHSGVDLTTSTDSQDNFSINPDGSYKYRLLVNGGAYDGAVSNEVDAPLSGVDTAFSGWSLDESMFITGVITPYVGSGKHALFTVTSLSDGSEVQGYLTYQWYRVNPVSYEMSMIPGATTPVYTTVPDDAGYYLICRASGDGVNVGGFIQIISKWAPEIPNKACVSDFVYNNGTLTGFRLNLDKSVPAGLAPDELKLSYQDGLSQVIVPITSVTHVENNAVFDISFTASIPPGVDSLLLENTSPFWIIVTEVPGGHMITPTVQIPI